MRPTTAITPFTVALVACLTAPVGLDQGASAWPPPTASIIAIAAGDLDADGDDDLIAVDVAGGRIYLLLGGVDVVPSRAAVTTASRSVALPGLRAPVAVVVAVATRSVVVFDSPAAGPRLTVFDAQLTETAQATVPIPAPGPGTTATLTPSTFGPAMNTIFGSVPNAVFYFEPDGIGDTPPLIAVLPQAGAIPFAAVASASGFVIPGNPATPRVFVSEPMRTQRADTSAPGVFTWTTVRSGMEWSAQTVADVTGDSFPDVVGFAPEGGAAAKLCVLDVQAGTTPPCFDTPFGMDTAALAVGGVVQPAQTDVVLLHVPPGGGQASLFVAPRIRIMGGNVVADNVSAPASFTIVAPLLALAQLDGVGGREIVLVGRDGNVICARASGSLPVRCAP